MKSVPLFLILLFCLGAAFPALAQTHTPKYVSMASNTNGYYEYLPEGYDASSAATYPLILFMTGIGEFGDGSPTQLQYVLKQGLPKLIEAGTFPKSFTVDGQTHRFIVITPQFKKNDRPTADDMEVVLNYITRNYKKVDVNRIYITGLSYGGGLSFAYAGANATYAKRVAAIVPIASPVPDGEDATIRARSRVIAANNVAVWATHNIRDRDDTVATTISYVNYINEPPAPVPPAKITIFNTGGHDAWTKTYNPTFKENGLNVYEWMLQYKRGTKPVNKAPQAAAGSDQSITLPTNSVTLKGSGTDADGNITGYTWTKVSGPSGGTITSPDAATTAVTALEQGSYVFRLTVTDDSSATASDEVSITVNAAPVPNQPPTANAGSDKTITLPENSASLDGTATDGDGTIVKYIWTKLSGPDAGNITNPNIAKTTVTGLVEGAYTFRLTVTDNDGATATDDVIVKVNAAPNKAPVADAGNDIVITLPVDNANLSGSGKDEDGTIASYLWTKVSGPSAGTITAKDAAATTVTGLVQGTYIFRLTVTDNLGATATDEVKVVVNAAANTAPKANASGDQTITLPANSVTLNGSGTDGDGSISNYAWIKVSGPAGERIMTPAAATTTVTNLQQGSYIFRLTVTDNDGATATDEVMITVNAAPNQAPKADAGGDQSITLPVNSVSLSGKGTDGDGTINSYGWTKVSGQAGSITNPAAATTTVTGLAEGSYTFRLTVTDNDGAIATDDLIITVNAASNKAPVANAGSDIVITLPVNKVDLSGSGTDEDGTISAYGWTKVSGPVEGNITNPATAATTATGLVKGTYTFRLTVTDNDGANATDEVKITVNAAANKAPAADAGNDIVITLPVDNANLSGSGSDEDGTITSYLWTKVSGPAGGVIAVKDAAATSVTGLLQGSYVFRLTVTDNDGDTDYDDIKITVNAAPNQAPVADAGADITITLPVNTATLSGSGTDADGMIASYLWTKISGPAQGVIVSKDAAETALNNLVQGVYTFRLTVTDNSGAFDNDDITVTVLAAPVVNVPPQATAGPDQSITLPVNSITLTGAGADTDGSIAKYSWTKISGPAGAAITSNAAAVTTITGLVQGSYVFRLTVTDNDGAATSDDITITVNAAPVANKPPIADAGADQTITLPASSITLNGTGTDGDGTISTYLWTKVSGPAGAGITSANAASTTVTALVQGIYVFRLTVKDDSGATAADDISITVNPAPVVNQAPKADAGADLKITLPANTATLIGTGTDSDGTIGRYAWTKISGPAGGVISTPDAATTTVTALQQGSYVFRLTVTDNSGATASDDVSVEVLVVTGVEDDPAALEYKLIVGPNPAVNYFSLKILSASTKAIHLRVTDAIGRVVEENTNLQRNSLFTIGHNYSPGVYHAELIQDGKRMVVKLLRL